MANQQNVPNIIVVTGNQIPAEAESKRLNKKSKIPSFFLLILLGVLLALGYAAYLVEISLPNPVSESESANRTFSEERAWKYLRQIVTDTPKVASSKYHLQKTADLKALVDDIASTAVQTVHTDWQLVTGDYWLAYERPFLNVYENVSNVIAVVEGASGFNADGTTNTSLLFNCHYDSVPTSPGASDNGVFCATFLETLYLLSRRTEKLKHNVIFLFNGAEENPLQGSPGFLKHPWSNDVMGVVNVDASGMNGKSIMFRETDPRVVAAYARSVPRPSAQAFGGTLFSSGIVPSDTDFRIFKELGSIYGVDIAFNMMGYVYHNRHDKLELLQSGVLQHCGDLIHEIAKEMANSDDFYTKVNNGTIINRRILGLLELVHALTYSESTANLVDSLVAILGVISILYYHWVVGFRFKLTISLICTTLGRILSVVAGAALVLGLTLGMVSTTIQLRYISHPWLVVAVYWLPYMIGAVLISLCFDECRCMKVSMNRSQRTAQAMAATRLILCVVMFVLLSVSGTATLRYIITLPLAWMSLTSFLSLTVLKITNIRAWPHLILELILAIPILMFLFVVAIKINALMLPVMGRSPTMTPDYIVAALNTALALLACLPLSGIELLFSRKRLWLWTFFALAVSVVLAFFPLNPYTGLVLQRHYWFHTEIITYNQTGAQIDRRTGIWFEHTEVNVPQSVLDVARDKDIVLNNTKTDFTEDCEQYLYCNFPMWIPKDIDSGPNSLWVDFSAPSIATPAPSLTLTNRSCQGDTCVLEFSATGPPQMSFTFAPRPNINLTSWSFTTPVQNTTEWRGRPGYYIYYSRATYSENIDPLDFSLTFIAPNISSNEPLIDLGFSAHRLSNDYEFTQDYINLLAAMPDWFSIATYLSSRYNYVF